MSNNFQSSGSEHQKCFGAHYRVTQMIIPHSGIFLRCLSLSHEIYNFENFSSDLNFHLGLGIAKLLSNRVANLTVSYVNHDLMIHS